MTIIVAFPQSNSRFGTSTSDHNLVLAKQSRQNIPIVIPLENNVTSNYVDAGVGDKNQWNDMLTAVIPSRNIGSTTGGPDLVKEAEMGGGQDGSKPNLGGIRGALLL